MVDDLWHKLCNFLSKYLVSIYFSQSTLLTSFPAVMGAFKVLDGRGEEIGNEEKQTAFDILTNEIFQVLTSVFWKAFQVPPFSL